jgi:hypothetical protein
MSPATYWLPNAITLQEIARAVAHEPKNGVLPAQVDPMFRPIIGQLDILPGDRATWLHDELTRLGWVEAEIRNLENRAYKLPPKGHVQVEEPWFKPQSARALMDEEFPPMRYAIPGVLPEGLSLFCSPPKMGKSFLMLHLGCVIGLGGYALKRRVQGRLNKLAGKKDDVPDALQMQYRGRGLDDGLLEAIDIWLTGHPQCRLVVIDTLAKVRGRTDASKSIYQQEYDLLAPVADLAHKHRIAIVVVHHTRKMSSDDVLETVSGSNGITAPVDAVLILQRGRGACEAVLHVISKDLDEDQALAFRYDPMIATYTLLGDAESVLRSKERNEVLDLLKKESDGLYPRQLAERLGLSPGVMRKRLFDMVQAGQVLSDNGKYKPRNGGNASNASNGGNASNVVFGIFDDEE